MSQKRSRRQFLKELALLGAGAVLAGCEPVVVTVEKPVIETVEVEKEVIQTVVVEKVIEKYYGRFVENGKSWMSEDHKRTPCPFLKAEGDKKACAIYLVRPLGCKSYPFETSFCPQDICPGEKNVYNKLDGEEV